MRSSSSEHKRMFIKRARQRVEGGTTQSVITSVSPDTETIRSSANGTDTFIAHPFASRDAWIRSMPSAGTRVTLAYNASTKRFDFVSYTPLTSSTRLEEYRDRKSLYRVLREGEHEIKSLGNAVSFWGSEGYQSTRTGVVQTVHDSDRLEHTTRAPTILLRNHKHKSDRIGNEIRFGVVKRPITNASENYVLKAPLSMPDAGLFTYSYEHLIHLTNDNDATLIDFRDGEVYEDLPQPGYPFSLPYLGSNNFPLRSRRRYYATIEPIGTGVPETYTEEEIDNFGNITWTLSKLAVIGFAIKVPFGSYNVNAMLQAEITGKLGVTVSSTVGKVTTSGLAGIVNTTPAKYTLDAKAGIDEKTNGKYSLNASAGALLESPLKIEIKGGTGVSIKADGPVEASSSTSTTLSGAMGKTGRPIATQATCFVTNLPFFIDPTLKS